MKQTAKQPRVQCAESERRCREQARIQCELDMCSDGTLAITTVRTALAGGRPPSLLNAEAL